MGGVRDAYANKAISQIARILSLEDRNEYSDTYGCFNREYWLCRTTDFPSAIAQMSVQSLALVYANEFPNNIYYKREKVKKWIWAGMDYWTKIQKSDGSFDEFYPNERGWAGPTGFLLYAMLDSYRMLNGDIPSGLKERFLKTCHKASIYLAEWDEAGILANHHAIALLAIYEAYLISNDSYVLKKFREKLDYFYTLCSKEGWSLEYDGADLGYLSATVSFLAKLRRLYSEDERLTEVIKKAIDFSSFFVYPNGFYAGTIGSRQTLHFYPHGYEIMAKGYPLSASIAEKMLVSYGEGKLVPPEIMSDRYYIYRIPELLHAYLDYSPREGILPQLPYERPPFRIYFEEAKIEIRKAKNYYSLINLSKGGVIKLFELDTNRLVIDDCGIIGRLDNGRVISSQWIDPDHSTKTDEKELSVSGDFHYISSHRLTPVKMILFRIILLLFGWHSMLAYKLKGLLRDLAITKCKKTPVSFKRIFRFEEKSVIIEDVIQLKDKGIGFKNLSIGDEFSVRYVPQSLYFQSQEFDVKGLSVPEDAVSKLNKEGVLRVKHMHEIFTGVTSLEWD